MSTNANKPERAVTDIDLMLYADGELEGEERAAVEAYLARDRKARRKLLAMGIVSDVVRDRALDAAAPLAGDIADRVMGAIDAEAKVEPPKEVVLVTEASEKKVERAPRRRRPANDNMRGLWMAAAVAAAAAAGLLLWGRSATQGTGTVASSHAPVPAITAPTASDDKHDGPKVDADDDHGVEVAAVDFGAQTGTVFYVPSGTSASMTTVVWLSDASGGDE
ncbi:Hypothetical protein A7982_10555 [Minicystis rosea]|nr:Hypothetical protein A7982_10555 [Minicystis rosea]